MAQTKREEQRPPLDLKTSERLGTTARAVAQGIGHAFTGDYTTQIADRLIAKSDRSAPPAIRAGELCPALVCRSQSVLGGRFIEKEASGGFHKLIGFSLSA